MKRLYWIAVGILLMSTGMVAVAQNKSSKPKPSVSKLRTNLKSLEQKKKTIASQLKQTRRETAAVLGDIEWVDREVDKFETAIDHTTNTLAASRREQAELAQALKKVEAELDLQRQQLRARLRSMYMQSSENPVSAIMASKSLGDLAIRKSVLERIASVDRNLFEGYKVRVAEVAVKKRQQDIVVKRIADLVERQRDYQQELKGAMAKKQGYLGELRDRASDLKEQYEALDRESDAIAAQIQSYQARNPSGPRYTGKFIRPVSARITSGFGSRFHPILKRQRMHTGVDFGARSGSPIWASASGTVISAGYRGGYGNAVIIDHGGGISTLYGHCSRVYVSAGQKVKQGQRIAAVGSTGLSTGPHLHFEIRVNGRPVNPMSRL